MRILLVQGTRGNYAGNVRRNGVELCRGATRRGISGPGRMNVPRALEATAAGALLLGTFSCPVMPQKTFPSFVGRGHDLGIVVQRPDDRVLFQERQHGLRRRGLAIEEL